MRVLSEKKRLAIVITHPVQYYAPVFQLLASRGNLEVHVFYTWGEGSIKKFDPSFGKVIQWDLPLLDGYAYTFLRNTSREPGSHHFNGIINPDGIAVIQAWKPDAILIYGWNYRSHLRYIRHFKGKIPVLFRGDSTVINSLSPYKEIARTIFLRWIYRHVDKALYVGTANKAYYRKMGLKDDQLVFAPHAIDNNRFGEDRSNEAEALRESLGIGEDESLVLFAGKLESVKTPVRLLEAFMQVNHPGSHLLFVGNGHLEEELRSNASGNPKIHFLPFQNQRSMPVMYSACDLFCLPSRSETWGLAVNEAMAAGKAVLVSDRVGCASDLVKEGENGTVFSSDDPASLRQALQSLLSSKKRLLQMGEASKAIISHWTFLEQVKGFEAVMGCKAVARWEEENVAAKP